ncbi:MAG: carboxypeptidase regulatory-like domain-containing protein [Bacteroidales bacterium]|nr:carboxypeptidase regulatory-like domain-containing protein [Bacteroidales bacterium]
MKKPITLTILLFAAVLTGYSQQITQTIRGTIKESDTEIPVAGAAVALLDMEPVIGTFSDENGEFRLEDIPVGRYNIQISARSFTIEETEKYAGSWGDPARMSLNFAGVMTANDQINAIIIRGNTPSGLLWKLDGVPIPNLNHFGNMGSTSVPINMLNNNTLSNSDFFRLLYSYSISSPTNYQWFQVFITSKQV